MQQDSKHNLLHIYDVCYTHTDIYRYSTIDLNCILFYQIYIYLRGGFRVQKMVVTNFCKIDIIYIKVIALIFVVVAVVIIIIANVAILFCFEILVVTA